MRFMLLLVAVLALPKSPLIAETKELTAEARYNSFVQGLDTGRIARGYPEAVKKLDSTDPKSQIHGMKTLAATGDIAAIPFIVPFLDSNDSYVRIRAGVALKQLVSSHELKRRDMNHPGKIVIKPRGPNDTDLRPLGWVIGKMLKKPDDGNTHAYAATMIGYLGLKEYETHLQQLLKSRHPAVQNAAKHAMDVLGIDYPLRTFSKEELAAAKQTAESFGKVFLAQDEDQFSLLLLPKGAVGKVFSQKFLEGWSEDQLYQKMVKSNLTRFKELRSMLGDTSKLSVSSYESGKEMQSSTYATKVRLMKNSYVVLAYANRVIVKVKIEEMVFFEGKCYIVELD